MKTNKVSINKRIIESKMDFVSLSKYFLITIGLLLIAGIVLISTIGFNLGFEFAGGTIIEVVYDIDADGTIYSEKQVKDIIDVAIIDYALNVSSIQKEKSSFGDRVVYKLTSETELKEEFTERISDDLYAMLGAYDKEDIVQSQYVKVFNVKGVANKNITSASIAISAAIALVFVGILIRYGLIQAISASLILILNVLTVIAFVSMSRVPLNIAFVSSIFITFFLTLIGVLIVFDKVRSNEKNVDYKKFTKKEHVNLAIKESFILLVLLLGFSLVAMIFTTGLGILSIRSFGIPALFGCILAVMSVVLGLPLLYTKITFKRK